MDTEKQSKLNQLLSANPSGIVFTSSWLIDCGYSLELQKRYKKSRWFESIGSGAMIRVGDHVGYEGAIYALQFQQNMTFHPGGITALSFLGKSHYLGFGLSKIHLFSQSREQLPSWFKNHDWGLDFAISKTDFLPSNLGMVEIEIKDFKIKISGATRAILECLYLTPKVHSIFECYELLEGLNNLRPKSVQELLEQCSSVKVKRLFLYLAQKAGHSWFNYINLNNVDLGNGKRALVKEGVYISDYQITVPKELEENGK